MTRTDDELKQLARDIHAGHVFTDRHLRPTDRQDMLGLVFMPLGLADRDQLAALKPALLFEYLDKAGPRSINGYPMFMTVGIVNEEELPKLLDYLKRLDEAPDPLADPVP